MVQSYVYIGRSPGTLPSAIKITYDGEEVHRVIASIITFWNGGNVTLRREDVAKVDPVTFTFSNGKILLAKIWKKSRPSNACTISVINVHPCRIFLDFDFLDAGDGLEMLVLHTGETLDPQLSGTIKGLSGAIPVLKPSSRRQRVFETEKDKMMFLSLVFLLNATDLATGLRSFISFYLIAWTSSEPLSRAVAFFLTLIAVGAALGLICRAILMIPRLSPSTRRSTPPPLHEAPEEVDVVSSSAPSETP